MSERTRRQPQLARVAFGASPAAMTTGFVALGTGLGAALFLAALGVLAIAGLWAVLTDSLF